MDRSTLAVWAGAAVVALGVGLAIPQETDRALELLALLLTVAVASAFAFLHPRWTLIAILFLLVAYVPDVLGPTDNASLVSHALAGLLIVAVVARRILGRDRTLELPQEMILFIALVLVMGLSAVFATDPAAGAYEALDFLGLGAFAALLMVLIDRTEWLRRAMWAVAAGMAALALLTILQRLTGSLAFDFLGFSRVVPQDGYARSGGPLSPNYFALVLTIAAIYSLYLALGSTRMSLRVLALAAWVVCLAGLAFTFSRASLIVLVVAGIAVALLRHVRVVLMIGILGGVIVGGVLLGPPGFQGRLDALGSSAVVGPAAVEDTAIKGRASEAIAAARMWLDHPILGVGPDNFQLHYQEYSQEIGLDPRAEERQAHNLYLETLAEVGGLGALAFFPILWMALAGAWRASRQLDGEAKLLTEAMFVAMLAFITNSLTLHVAYARYLWIILGLALAARRLPDALRAQSVGEGGG